MSVALVTAAVLAAAACGSDGARPEAQAQGQGPHMPANPTFADMLRAVQRDYEPAQTFEELARRSQAVVLGRLARVVEGRVAGASRTDPARTEHLVMVFDVERVVAGAIEAGAGQVYVEYPHSQAWPASAFDAAAPKGARAVLYLVPAPRTVAVAGQQVFDATAGVPDGRVLRTLTTPQGLLLEAGGQVIAPLQRVAPAQLFPGEQPDGTAIESWLPAT